jgi:hypothetical protein
MIQRERIPQTLLLSGPEGVGKATLARHFAAQLLGYGTDKIEQDDLSLDSNAALIADREKWTADKRNEDPLVFSSHPDFLTFAPDGPLRQVTIPQMRLLKERAPLKPLKGSWRVFLIDSIDRANPQAANSLLKTLEEPPPHLILIMTARNLYDLLPTIRSRAVPFQLGRLRDDEMQAFLKTRGLDQPERRLSLAEGAPGIAVSIDLEVYDRRRTAMLALLKVAAGQERFDTWPIPSRRAAARNWKRIWKCCTRCWRTSCVWGMVLRPSATMTYAPSWRLWPGVSILTGFAKLLRAWMSWWNWGGATFRSRLHSMPSPPVCANASAVLSMNERRAGPKPR